MKTALAARVVSCVTPDRVDAYQRDGAVCVRAPPFPGLADVLPAGVPMDHALFPLLWQRDR